MRLGGEQLETLLEQCTACVRCPRLAATRTQVVFGTGGPDAAVLLLAEAPGNDEDARGLPLTGRAADLLEQALAEDAGLGPGDVFLTTAVKCRPPDGRDPDPREVERCRDWLEAQLEAVEPQVLVTLGDWPTKYVTGEVRPIRAVRGRAEVRTFGPWTGPVLPVFHPAAALYGREAILRADLALLPGLLAGRRPQPPPAPDDPGPLTLF